MLRILRDEASIQAARKKLRELGCDSSVGWRRALFKACYALRFRMPAEPVAVNKSWDVLTMLQTITRLKPDRSSAVFEMGSYNSEIPLALWASGYRKIRAADFNPLGRCINWYGNAIDFHKESFYEPGVPDHSLDVITALSVIEHGYDQAHLISTIHRLLKPGGLFCLTTDYHAEKVAIPDDFRIFDLTYRIFSRPEIESLIKDAEAAGLKLAGDIDWGPTTYPIDFLGHKFTFIFLAFVKQ